jgi:hypothetical protein
MAPNKKPMIIKTQYMHHPMWISNLALNFLKTRIMAVPRSRRTAGIIQTPNTACSAYLITAA